MVLAMLLDAASSVPNNLLAATRVLPASSSSFWRMYLSMSVENSPSTRRNVDPAAPVNDAACDIMLFTVLLTWLRMSLAASSAAFAALLTAAAVTAVG